MTVPAWLVVNTFPLAWGRRLRCWTAAALSPIMARLDSPPLYQRRAFAITGSVLLHLCLVLLLLPSETGLRASIGTATGLGSVNGAGTAVTLVDVSELTPPNASEKEGQTAAAEPSVAAPEPTDISETQDVATLADQLVSPAERQEAAIDQVSKSNAKANSESTAEATAGAFGQNGQANIDLWNAIAPCWNHIADGATLPATLKISFDATGALAVPPEIERDPDAPITDQSLKSEAQALQALAECGAYLMAQGQQDVVVQFPSPEQMPSAISGNQTKIAAVQP